MKKLIILAALYLMMLGTLAAKTQTIVIEQQRNGKVLVGYELYKRVRVVIQDSEGAVVYSTRRKGDGIRLVRYDLSLLPDSTYTIKVISPDLIKQKTLTF